MDRKDRMRGVGHGALGIMLFFVVSAGLALAGEARVTARQPDAPPQDDYVPVRLDAYANDQLDAEFPSAQVLVEGVPFDLVQKAGANNLFLKNAGWADSKADPSDYYEGYDTDPPGNDPNRVILHLPVADYSAVYLLAATDNSEAFSPVVSFRMGAFGGEQVSYQDFSAQVPRMKEADGGLATVRTAGGNLFLVRVPLGKAIAQDFKDRQTLDVDVTKELRLAVRRPDPCRYRVRPLGLPSGVRILGMTFQLSPVQMEVQSAEPGHVFNQPQDPTFLLTLRLARGPALDCSIETVATHYYGEVSRAEREVIAAPGIETVRVPLPVQVGKRGYYDLEIRLKVGGQVVLTRQTSFALLAPDTRQHRAESPFGTWDFSGGHFTPNDPDLLGPLYVKAGLRCGMFHQPDEVYQKYSVVRGNDAAVGADYVIKIAEETKQAPNVPAPQRLMIFHETGISGLHITRIPSLFSGKEYKFDDEEQKTFQSLWDNAMATAKAIREHFPKAEIYFGNGNPQLLEEFAKRKFPTELLGSRGNEAGNYMRMPEGQPPDWICNGAGLWMDREILDRYGYADTPLRQCYEMCYPGTNPGNLSLRTQANYYVRHMMHSLAWEIPVIRALLITDVGNSYYFSNWGSAGFCHARPHVRPKPSYVACATMTLALDGAKFTRVVPSGSPVVYAVEFKRPDGSFVTCLWTVRGTRPVLVGVERPGETVLTDMMGNDTKPAPQEQAVRVTISPEPVFLRTAAAIGQITPGVPVIEGTPAGEKFLVSALDELADWTVEEGQDVELETFSFMCPRRKGNFEYAQAAEFEGEQGVLQVRPRLPVEGSPYLPMYSVLRHNAGVQMPGQPTKIGLMVNGNGGWGRVMFELEGADGQRWVSIGAEQAGEPTRWLADLLTPEQFASLKASGVNDWNTDDPWGRSYINFDGWRYLEFPLPGNYPGEGYHWPYSSQWRHSGDGIVRYPLTFRKLIITLPEKALRLKEYAPAPRQEVYLKDLMVTYQPPEQAFHAE